eukprot:5077407-Pyramimonas_sp.AAC.1
MGSRIDAYPYPSELRYCGTISSLPFACENLAVVQGVVDLRRRKNLRESFVVYCEIDVSCSESVLFS